MTIEREKKKRSEERNSGEQEAVKTKKAREAEEEALLEEEVEQFFAILKRMRVAVQYFEKGKNKEGRPWREAVEAEVAVAVGVKDADNNDNNDNDKKEKLMVTKMENVEKCSGSGGLDLNVTPDAETNGDV